MYRPPTRPLLKRMSWWQAWASHKMEELPVLRPPRLDVNRRDGARTRVLNLEKWAAGPVDVGIVGQFFYCLRDRQGRPRLGGRPRSTAYLSDLYNGCIRLSDLSDVELVMLREEDSLADQLFLTLGS